MWLVETAGHKALAPLCAAVLVFSAASCATPRSKETSDPPQEVSPVLITSMCALRSDQLQSAESSTRATSTETNSSPTSDVDGAFSNVCVPLLRPSLIMFAPLPFITDAKLEEAKEGLAVVGCLSSSRGPVASIGLVPMSLLPAGIGAGARGGVSTDELCGKLPKRGHTAAGSSAPSVGGGSRLKAAFDACTTNLGSPGQNPRPVFGPEMVSSGWGIGVGIAAGLLDVGKLTPEQKIAVGAGLLFVVAPTLGALAVAFPVAAPALLAVGEEAVSTGVVVLGTGIYEKASSPEPSKPPPSAPQGSPSDSRPDPNADQAPDSCMKALALVARCLGQREPCEDPELAAALKAARDRACQNDKVLVDPNSDYCGTKQASEEQIAKALVDLCQASMRNRKPVPGESPCPFMFGAGTGTFSSTIPLVCLQQMGDWLNCPRMGEPDPLDPGGPLPCPPGPEAVKCGAPGQGSSERHT